MFHESFLAPVAQTNRFRSPDVALLPFVAGSTHAVMTPLWTPGVALLLAVWVLLAAEIAATTANTTTAAAAISVVDGDFI